MSNIIQTKRGHGKPDGKLAPYEFGIDIDDGQLYYGGEISENGYGNAQGIKVAIAAGTMTLVNTNGEPYDAGANNIPVFLEKGVIKPCTSGEVSIGLIAESAQRWTNKKKFSVSLNKEGEQTADVDGSAEVNLGVTGILPIAKGGTGATTIDGVKTNLGLQNSNLINLIYPIGSIYISINPTSPTELFGGTWEQIQNVFLLAASETIGAGTTGGSNVHSHGLNSGYAQINHHDGKFYFAEKNLGDDTFTSTGSGEAKGANETSNQTDVVSLGGTTETSSSLPPYLAVYMWKRTA